MKPEEKIAWLKRYHSNEQELDRLTDEMRHWASRAEGFSSSFASASGAKGGTHNTMQRAIEQIAEVQGRILAQIDAAVQLRAEVEAAVFRVADPKHRILLGYRYLNGAKWSEIAEQMDCTLQWVHKLHERAIEELPL